MTFRERINQIQRCTGRCRRVRPKDLLLPLIISGAVLGFLVGALISSTINAIESPEERKTTLMLVGFPGELLMNMLKMIVLPLIIASLITALSSLDSKSAGKIGRRVLAYYLTTTLCASIIGVVMVVSIRPGRIQGVEKSSTLGTSTKYRTLDSLLDLLRNIFPSNIVAACFMSYKTQYSSEPGKYDSYNITSNTTLPSTKTTIQVFNNGTHNITMVTREVYGPSNNVPAGTKSALGVNIVGITAFCVAFGLMLGQLREKGLPLKVLFSALNDVVMKIVTLIMWFSPIGIFSLVCAKIAQMDDALETLQMIGLFILTVLSGVFIHGFVALPLIYFVLTRRNPFKFMVGMGDALVTAFGISSSAATLPTTIRCAEENKYNKVDSRIASFVLPLGATVNMDGGAVFEGVVGIFVAQMNGIETTPAFLFTTILMAVAISVGAGGIPSAGFIYPVILLQTLGLPVEDLALILPVEWLLDRFRTALNVWGDSVGAGIVNLLSRDDLLELDAQMAENGEVERLAQSPPTSNSFDDRGENTLSGYTAVKVDVQVCAEHETTF